ncbi:hypothetical protein RhiirA5_385250 [Rhizophagus irregularis]|uniref:Uncharacterized protein n=2 Tax=Rhizophagus irregularis TaxID=588596 RepID=A0A2N0NPV1_9GLOM|nr:hypothetical protein RhiirA5_385250 [Rhizophagus irregularis]
MSKRKCNTYQLNNPLRLRHRYSHIPLQNRNENFTNDLSRNNTIINILPPQSYITHRSNTSTEIIEQAGDSSNEIKDPDDDNEVSLDNTGDYYDNMTESDEGSYDSTESGYDNTTEDDENYDNTDDEYIGDYEHRENTYDDTEEQANIEQNENDKQIVDEALDPSILPHEFSDFLPYFNNATEALLFCWIQKHNISTNAYDDLVSIINDPRFKREEVVTNIRRFRQWRQRLPLSTIFARPVSISSKKSPSTSKACKLAYHLSISDIIWYVLNNPAIMKHMYFGPGIDTGKKSEFWHGSLWAESPLFGQEDIIISQVKYRTGSFIYYQSSIQKLGFLRSIQRDEENKIILKIQQLVFYEELPGIFKGISRQQRANSGEVWMLDENIITINPSSVLRKATVKLPYLNQSLTPGELNVKEIIYKYKNHWRIRDINMSYLHPAHYISTNNSPTSSLPVYKLFLDMYYDDFGTYRNVYHSLGGVYIQFGNMPANLRKLVKNHFVISFVPFGGSFDEFILPFVKELKEFEKGKVMSVQGQEAWVIAGLGVVTADLPQGNDLAGVQFQFILL